MKSMNVDIEISDIFDLNRGEDMEKYTPFRVAVAATAVYGGAEELCLSADDDGKPLSDMTASKAGEILQYLFEHQKKGFMVRAWNGLSFDFRWLVTLHKA